MLYLLRLLFGEETPSILEYLKVLKNTKFSLPVENPLLIGSEWKISNDKIVVTYTLSESFEMVKLRLVGRLGSLSLTFRGGKVSTIVQDGVVVHNPELSTQENLLVLQFLTRTRKACRVFEKYID